MPQTTAQTGAPGGVMRLRQLCLAVPELRSAEQVLQDQLGLSVAFRDPNLIRFGLENAVLPLGPHQFIELVAPVQPDTAVDRFLARGQGKAPGAYMLIFDCEDPSAARQRAQALGVRVIHEMNYANYHGVQLHPRDTGATMLEFCRTPGGEALDGPYYPAGPDWQQHVVHNGIDGIAQVKVECANVCELAERWSALMGRAVVGHAPMTGKLIFELSQLVFEPGEADAVTKVRLSGTKAVDFTLAGVRFVTL